MAEAAELEKAFIRAVASSAIVYPDYKTSENFLNWLSGLEVRVREAYRLNLDDKDVFEEEMCQSIPARLSVGEALNAYNRLTTAETKDYNLLRRRLTEEFTDEHEQRLFRENMGFNRRKKGQKLNEFAQEIKDDMSRYSGLPDKVTEGGAEVANPAKEQEGVRRFRAGIRDGKGQKNKDLTRHLLFHLMEDADLTWENAIMVASRWEMASTGSTKLTKPVASSSSSDDSSSDNEIEAIDNVKEEITSDKRSLSSLAEQIASNSVRIAKIEASQMNEG